MIGTVADESQVIADGQPPGWAGLEHGARLCVRIHVDGAEHFQGNQGGILVCQMGIEHGWTAAVVFLISSLDKNAQKTRHPEKADPTKGVKGALHKKTMAQAGQLSPLSTDRLPAGFHLKQSRNFHARLQPGDLLNSDHKNNIGETSVQLRSRGEIRSRSDLRKLHRQSYIDLLKADKNKNDSYRQLCNLSCP